MSDFESFWRDKSIPARMKRCGPAPVRKALDARNMNNEAGYRQILDSLPGYERNKPDYADYCMLSTYINQERDLVPWDEMDERPVTVSEQKDSLQRARVKGYQSTGYWKEDWGPEPNLRVVK